MLACFNLIQYFSWMFVVNLATNLDYVLSQLSFWLKNMIPYFISSITFLGRPGFFLVLDFSSFDCISFSSVLSFKSTKTLFLVTFGSSLIISHLEQPYSFLFLKTLVRFHMDACIWNNGSSIEMFFLTFNCLLFYATLLGFLFLHFLAQICVLCCKFLLYNCYEYL